MSDQDRVDIAAVTLRDAEQTPGSQLAVREKMEVAHQEKELGVHVIEAGFPASSSEDFEAVRRIAHEIEGPIICALARVVPRDIERAGEALRGAPRPRIHTFVGTSQINMQRQLRKTPEQVLRMAVEAVQLARGYCADVEFSPMDATRTDEDFLGEVVEATLEAGATVINIPDTVGIAVPEEFGLLVRYVVNIVAGRAIVSVHCHDDLGMAVANTLAGLKNGARQAECTINGLGERAGNASLEEIVMALKVRSDYFGLTTGVDTIQLLRTSRLVSRLMRSAVPRNKAIVGANAFAHSSGIHQDGVLKERATFEIMSPEDVGVESTQIVLTARSGRHALRHRLEQLGHTFSKEEIDKVYERFLEVADKKTEIYDDDLLAIVGDEIRDVPEKYRLDYLHSFSGTGTVPSATVRLEINGQMCQESAWGDGPVDAAYRAIGKIVDAEFRVDEYAIHAVTSGSQAMGEVTVRVRVNGGPCVVGRGASTDIIEASAKAYIDGLNRLAALAGRAPQVAAAG